MRPLAPEPSPCEIARPQYRSGGDGEADVDFDRRQEDWRLGGYLMRAVRWLAVLPFLAMLVGPFFLNRVSPPVLGMRFLLAWLVAWIFLTSVIWR
jgi:hypothetical protein